jgi:hypothetical protein
MPRVQRQDWAEAEGRVYWFDNFLEAPRCEGILAELEFAFWRPSTVYLEGEDGKHQYVYSRRRVSSTTSERWFTPSLRRAIALIDRRVGRHLPQAPSRARRGDAVPALGFIGQELKRPPSDLEQSGLERAERPRHAACVDACAERSENNSGHVDSTTRRLGGDAEEEVTMTREQKAAVAKVIKKYGSKIDLEAKPEVLIEILRSFGRLFDDDGDGGAKPGGVGPNPCLVEDGRVTEQEIMKAILHLSREVASIKSMIKPRT